MLVVVAFILSISAVNAQETDEYQTSDSELEVTAVSSDTHQGIAAGSEGSALEDANAPSEDGAYLVLDNDADKENIHVGDYVTWILEASNYGPNTAKNVNVYDKLPKGLEYVKHTATKGIFNPTTGIWEIGDLGINEGIVTLYITTKALTVGEKINEAFITSDTPNLNPEDYESEEIDVLDDVDDSRSHDFGRFVSAKTGLYEAGNPIFLFLMAIFMLFIPVIRK